MGQACCIDPGHVKTNVPLNKNTHAVPVDADGEVLGFSEKDAKTGRGVPPAAAAVAPTAASASNRPAVAPPRSSNRVKDPPVASAFAAPTAPAAGTSPAAPSPSTSNCVKELPILKPQLQVFKGSWAWIRNDNGPAHRKVRLEAAQRLLEAFKAGGYAVKCGGALHEVRFERVSDMLARTSVLSISAGLPGLPKNPGHATEYESNSGSPIERSAELSIHGFQPVMLSAASAYHAGGGFDSGGRHALEEALCMQSTLYASLQKVAAESKGPAHIPEDGVIISPGVEIFRRGSDQGYPLHQATAPIAAVISVAMYNRNSKVKDAPVDAPRDKATYEKRTKDKLKVAVHGSVVSGADVLLMPDIGCGVFDNDPKLIGRLAGEVLKEYSGHLKKVVFTGKQEFCNAAASALNCKLVRHSAPSCEVPLCKECIVCGKPFVSVANLAIVLSSKGRRVCPTSGDQQPGIRFLHIACEDELHRIHPEYTTMALPEVTTDPEHFLRALDVDGNGALSYAEIHCAAAALSSNSAAWTAQNEKEFEKLFKKWDKDGTGELHLSELSSNVPQEFLEWVRQRR